MSSLEQRLIAALPLFRKYSSPISIATRMAQFALESQAGASELFLKSNNGFGIKVSAPWTGEPVEHLSGEVGGARVSEFRKYESLEESVKDHAGFFESTGFRKTDEVYGLAIKADNYKDEAKNLGPKFPGDKYSYAGDPNYAKKLIEIIERYNLTQYDEKGSAQKMGHIGLDIGHGSNTWSSGGGKGVKTGGKIYEEHIFNSIVGKKLKSLLEKSGHKVTFGVQQPNGPEQSLRARTNKFNADKVDIMLSIHANWIGTFKNNTNGIGAFFANYSAGSRSNQSKKLADLIMSEYRKQKQSIYGAGSIPSVLSNWTNFHMTRESSMPAVLMELGFMSGTTDFDKIFGSQQDKYTTEMAEGMARGINAYFGVSAEVKSNNDFKLPDYKEPAQPFKKLNVGDKVTIRKGQTFWYIPDNMGRKPSKDFNGDVDVITKVMDVSAGYSKRAYLLKDKVSWILEQDLVEPRAEWSSEQKDQQEQLDYIYIDGVKRAIGEVIE